MASVTITRGNTLPDSSAKSDFHNLIDQATGTVTGIVNADVDSSAAIANSKLNLASITQVVGMTSKMFKLAQGANIASASALALGTDGNLFYITGTTSITSITSVPQAGTVVVLWFASALTMTDGSNLVLQGNFTTAANDTMTLVSDGTNMIEIGRSRYTTIAPVTLTDQATIATDATASSHYRVTLAGNRTLGNPTGARDGQKMVWQIKQDATGGRTITLDSKFDVADDVGTVTLSTSGTATDWIGAVYDSAADKFYVISFVKGN